MARANDGPLEWRCVCFLSVSGTTCTMYVCWSTSGGSVLGHLLLQNVSGIVFQQYNLHREIIQQS